MAVLGFARWSLLLLLVSCGTPSVVVKFAVPEGGLNLNVPSLPVDLMVLGGTPKEEAELADKLRDSAVRGKWFNQQDRGMRELRERLRRQGKLASLEVRNRQRELPSRTLSMGEFPQGAVLVAVADIPAAGEQGKNPLDTTAILEVKKFLVRIVGDWIEVQPAGKD